MPQPADQLVGRAAELEVLDQALAELERRRSGALELVGEPGIGKTRMLAELSERADARGQITLSGSASELERELPFSIFVDALDDYVQALEPRRLEDLDDDARAELAHAFPALSARDARTTAAPELYRIHRAVRQLLEALAATQPLVLLLDDLHWADAGSIELLGALLRRAPAAGVLIALAVRPRQLPERLSGALERAIRARTLTRIELGALSADEAGELLGADATALYEESGGNPFYLLQLARSPQRHASRASVALAGVQVPQAVAAALSDELALLPDGVRRLLEGAAVAGDPFEADLAAAAAGTDDASALDALDALLARDLVRHTDVPRRFRFRHPLVRGAVYEAAPGGWRLGAHERCAALLAERGASAAERAHHVERSARHGDLAAVAVLREAGEAAAASAPATAARLFDAALRLLGPQAPERVELLAALAQAHFGCGQLAQAHAATVESLELLPPDAHSARVRLTAFCAGVENLLGRHREARERLGQALESLSDERSAEAVLLTLQLAIDRFYHMDYASMSDTAQRALELARPLGDRPLTASAAGILTLALASAGAVAEAEASCDTAAALADDLSDEELALCLTHGVDGLAGGEMYIGRLADASRHAERALAVARATGRGQQLPVLYWAGWSRLMCGRLAGAAEIFDSAVEIARTSGHAEGIAWNLSGRSLTATAAGDVEDALSAAEEAVEALQGLASAFPGAAAGFALAAALLPAGDAPRAVAVLLSASGGEELAGIPASWRPGGFELLTRCWLALGRTGEAARAAASAGAWAESLGWPLPVAMADRAAAAGAIVEGALSRVVAGPALAQAGEPERAAAELERAAATLDGCGALRRRDAAERELRRLGRRNVHRRTRAGNADGDGVESLTERELQVARLVVDRMTNPQIAAELFLSQKTVETHIRNLFHKLGVSSRVEVARAVERADRELRSAR